jgi:hypothetical protein
VVFSTGCHSGLSGWYLMFCAGQYVVGGTERTLWAERICKLALTSASERSESPAVRAPFHG